MVVKSRRVSKPKRGTKKVGGKRKMNTFFKKMMEAKSKGQKSFTYNGSTYSYKKKGHLEFYTKN